MRPRQDWCSSLGAQAQKLFKHSCEEAPLMELAKWGLAVVARIVEDTHKVYDEYASFPVYWKQVLPAISAAIKKGEPYMHQPKHNCMFRDACTEFGPLFALSFHVEFRHSKVWGYHNTWVLVAPRAWSSSSCSSAAAASSYSSKRQTATGT
eukprot:g59512.t1